MVLRYRNAQGRKLKGVATPLRVNGKRSALRRVSPGLGQDSRAILRELGHDDETIRRWIETGVVASGEDAPP